ncbi:MAG: hypothetical protein HC855_11835 [Rhizobiales bacterium]|nr:hypothetical protein [Hyphomicrobiales bacterium]
MFGMLKYALPVAAALLIGASTGQAGVAGAAKAQASAFDGASLATQIHYKKKRFRKHGYKRHRMKRRGHSYYGYHPRVRYWSPYASYSWHPRRHHYYDGPVLIYRRSTIWYYDDCWPGRWCY